ncbi:hypothetical protein KAU55_04950 [Candidatus Bathyarchaeota archaeon]|nr:hypothetical protein [Candidatus Bathyarchaeota archaeon]
MKKTTLEIVEEAYDELVKLRPTPEEIQEYANLKEDGYGVVTYSKSKGGDYYFLRLHNTSRKKFGGRIHIDIGYVDEKYVGEWNVPDTTHLMLDKYDAPDFVEFVKNKRKA